MSEAVSKQSANRVKRIIDQDTILNNEDRVALENYRKEKKKNELTSHEDLVKELEL